MSRITIAMASAEQMDRIYRARHDVYAAELGQHHTNPEGRLTDALDGRVQYIVACRGDDMLGFVSVTPPSACAYSIDKYFDRSSLPFRVDGGVFEIRLLTVLKPRRGSAVASLLMLAAFRLAAAQGACRVVAIGRVQLRQFYERLGLRMHGLIAKSGAVQYELMSATVAHLRAQMQRNGSVVRRLEQCADWDTVFAADADACYHGGASFDAIGDGFARLDRADSIVTADVLDAWFPPSPRAVEALSSRLPWLLRTSPPAGCGGLARAIAEARSLPLSSIVLGSGSSDLMFRAMRLWLATSSRVLLPEPTYGEYAHILERVIGCQVDRWPLRLDADLRVSVDDLLARLQRVPYDMLILVNPNNPTGRLIPAPEMERLLDQAPAGARIWVDEAYLDYADPDATCEHAAAHRANVVVCKSLSKVYALSGARVAYLVTRAQEAAELRRITPPWAVSLPAQVAAVAALSDHDYYRRRWAETAVLRARLSAALADAIPDLTIRGSCANFVLCLLPCGAPSSADVCEACRLHDVYLRDLGDMGQGLGPRFIRIAVKDKAANARIVAALRAALGSANAD